MFGSLVFANIVAAQVVLGHHASLHWIRDDAGACIDERALADAVTARLGDEVAGDATNDLVIDGTIEHVAVVGARRSTHEMATIDLTSAP